MKNQRKIDLIVVHCSATRINQDFPVEALEACHKARGFHSIGYHYYITKDGVVYPCRPESEEGDDEVDDFLDCFFFHCC
jgi:N-acetylmuramoyl-L-alanine amidase